MRVLNATALAACSTRTPSERERALERIPASAQMILSADGSALATTAFRRVVDSLTPHVPPSLACVAEAAVTSEAIAVGVELHVGTTVVLVTRATAEHCPALSQVATHIWTATIGAGAPVTERAKSMLAAPAWDRARPYLINEPLALAAELPQFRLVGVAQPEPVDAWLAVDAVDSVGVERTIKAMIDRWRTPSTIELSGKLVVQRKGTQVAVQADGLVVEDLLTILTDTLRVAEEPTPAPTPAATFACPAQTGNGVISCHDGTQYKVSSVETIVRELAAVASVPVIAGGDIVGIRLTSAPPRLLQQGDVILGVNSHRITEASQLTTLAAHLGGKVSIAVRRAGVDAVLELGE